jgi:hypothetical protein
MKVKLVDCQEDASTKGNKLQLLERKVDVGDQTSISMKEWTLLPLLRDSSNWVVKETYSI